MPIIPSKYKAPWYLKNGHISTIYPNLFRNPANSYQYRERWELPDGDFLDVDWIRHQSQSLLILLHGLEGSTTSQYMVGAANFFNKKKWDVLAINFRSCSGVMNRKLRMYHHGEIDDLKFILQKVIEYDQYKSIHLAGYSLGGNVVIKYLGVYAAEIPETVKSGVAISVPSDLHSSSKALDQWFNYLYTQRFRKNLKPKIQAKAQMYPDVLDMSKWDQINSWKEFDTIYTSNIYGFEDYREYYDQGSANNFLHLVRRQVLVVNALNDPFLKSPSYPTKSAEDNQYIYLEMPEHGGHVGFLYANLKDCYTDIRMEKFFLETQ